MQERVFDKPLYDGVAPFSSIKGAIQLERIESYIFLYSKQHLKNTPSHFYHSALDTTMKNTIISNNILNNTRGKYMLDQSSWQHILKDSITDPLELLHELNLEDTLKYPSKEVLAQFPCRVPRPLLHKMEKGNPLDPLLKQVLPINEELDIKTGYSLDPLKEASFNVTSGLLHKYKSRVLVTLTGACAINCRYCFRRHFPYSDNSFSYDRWNSILNYLKQDDNINEVIFSGGDPLCLKDSLLKNLIKDLECVKHIHTLRIHTRFPIVIPQRITQSLIETLSETSLKIVVVFHVNHSNEIDVPTKQKIQELSKNNITLLNQSVLLKNINDDTETLYALSNTLFNSSILPYYLHIVDKVQGCAHFSVNNSKGITLINSLRDMLPGYLVPRLTQETAFEKAKTIIA